LPKVKNFLKNIAQNYANLEVKYTPGVDPRVIFYDGDKEVERRNLADLDEAGIAEFIQSKGIHLKQ